MTQDEQEKMIKDYLDAVLDAFKEKALAYYNKPGQTVNRFTRATEIKNALKGIGTIETFGIAAGDYSHCPSGQCNGGVCTRELPFNDAQLRQLAQELSVPEAVIFNL